MSYTVGGVGGVASSLVQPHTPVAALLGYVNFNEELVELQRHDESAGHRTEDAASDISDDISDGVAAQSSDSEALFATPQPGSPQEATDTPPATPTAASPELEPSPATPGAPAEATPPSPPDSSSPLLRALLDEAVRDVLAAKKAKQEQANAQPAAQPSVPSAAAAAAAGDDAGNGSSGNLHELHPVGHRAAEPARTASVRTDSYSDEEADDNQQEVQQEQSDVKEEHTPPSPTADASPIARDTAIVSPPASPPTAVEPPTTPPGTTVASTNDDGGPTSPPAKTVDGDAIADAVWGGLLDSVWRDAERAWAQKRTAQPPASTAPRPTINTSSPALEGVTGGGALESPSAGSPVELEAAGFSSPATPPAHGYGGGGSSPRDSAVETYVSPASAAAARKSPVAAVVSGGLSPASPDLHALGGSQGSSPLSASSRDDSEPDLYADESFELDGSEDDGDEEGWYNFEGMADSLSGGLGGTLKRSGGGSPAASSPLASSSLGSLPALAGQSAPAQDTRPGSRNGEGDSAEHNPYVEVARERDNLKHQWAEDAAEFCGEIWAHIDEHAQLATTPAGGGGLSGRSGGVSISHSSGSGLTLPMRLSAARWAHFVLDAPPSGVPVTDEHAEIAAAGPLPVDLFVLLEQSRSHAPRAGGGRLSPQQLERIQVRHKLMFDALNESWSTPPEVAALRKHLKQARIARRENLHGAPGPDDAAQVLVYLSKVRAASVSRVKRMAAALTLPAPQDASSDDALAAYAKHGWVGPPMFGEHALTRAGIAGRKAAIATDAPLRMASDEVAQQRNAVACQLADAIFEDLLEDFTQELATIADKN